MTVFPPVASKQQNHRLDAQWEMKFRFDNFLGNIFLMEFLEAGAKPLRDRIMLLGRIGGAFRLGKAHH